MTFISKIKTRFKRLGRFGWFMFMGIVLSNWIGLGLFRFDRIQNVILAILLVLVLSGICWYLYWLATQKDIASQQQKLSLWQSWPKAGVILALMVGVEIAVFVLLFNFDFFYCGSFDLIRRFDGCEGRLESTMITSMSISADGKLLVGAEFDKGISLWSLPDQTLLRSLDNISGRHGLLNVAISPKGDVLAVGTYSGPVSLWQIPDGKLLHTLVEENKGNGYVSFSADGTLVAADGDSIIRIWTVQDGVLIRTLKHEHVNLLTFSPSEDIIASTDRGSIKLWGVSDGTLLHDLEHHAEITAIAFSPDGSILASVGTSLVEPGNWKSGWNSTIKLWRVVDGMLIRTIEQRNAHITTLAYSPEGTLLVTGDDRDCYSPREIWQTQCVTLWQTTDGEIFREIKVPNSAHSLIFSPIDKQLVISSFDGVYFWQP